MKLSFDWLCDFVDIRDTSVQEVADKLTMGAFEVEEVRQVGPNISGPVVVGEIVEINPHPNADKIRATRVKVDESSAPLDIVCGASNIIVGQRVPVALPGARVINRHDGSALHIKASKIRGVQSNGMLCSPPELGIADGESEGILILDGSPALGTDVIQLLQLYPDSILHVGTRSNRGDALSVLGMAREVAALFNRPLREMQWQLPEADQTSEEIAINIENLQDCPFFSLRTLQGVKVGPSPFSIKRRLEAVGVRPVNNVVDVTNYVLHELGQPLHAYDLSKLPSRSMTIRRAKGEQLTTLDGKTRELSDDVLIIADGSGPLGVAGVMGGQDSEITAGTTFVALEAAAFAPSRVRRASRLLGLSSESSLRFERGVDVACVRKASDRAAALILQSCGGFLGRITFGGNDRVKEQRVGLRLAELKRITEIDLDSKQVVDLLQRLEFKGQIVDDHNLELSVPSFRQKDVAREIDLIEEICRLWGYDRVPVSMPAATVAPERADDTEVLARQALIASGLNEACLSSLVGLDPLGTGRSESPTQVRVLNPLSEDHQVLRQSLAPGLIKAAAYNQDYGNKDIWLFEVGRVYRLAGESLCRQTGVTEELKTGAILAGSCRLSAWQEAGKADDNSASNFFLAKGVVENLLAKLMLEKEKIAFVSAHDLPDFLHPGRSCLVTYETNGSAKPMGWLGDLHPATADKLGLRMAVSLFELSLDNLRAWRARPQFRDIHNTPYVVRDLTADFGKQIAHASVERSVKQAAGPHLQQLELVSVFDVNDKLRSLSYRLTFQNAGATLTAGEVEEYLSATREKLKSDLGATFRT